MSPERETRRDFNERLLPRALGLGLGFSFISNAFADKKPEEIEQVCSIRKDMADVIELVCSADIDTPEKRVMLLKSMRSSPAFAELAEHINPDSKEKGVMRFLYPASGSHIAPLMMAADLFNKGKISEAEFTYTDIDHCKLLEIKENLQSLCRVNPDFSFDSDETEAEQCGKGGEKFQFCITYLGYPITINFLLSCSGEDYYRTDDFADSDVFIQHDTMGKHPDRILYFISQYFTSQRKSSKKPPTIVMEDLTAVKEDHSDEYTRRFDMELLGALHRGDHFYGHREHLKSDIGYTPEIQACRSKEDMNISNELAEPAIKNGLVLNVHPALLELDPGLITILMEISFAAHNNGTTWSGGVGYSTPRINDTFKGFISAVDLFSGDFYQDVFEHGEEIIKTVAKADPKLASSLAIRIIQILLKFREGALPEYIKKVYTDNPDEGYEKVTEFFNSVFSYLDDSTRFELARYINATRDYFGRYQKSHSLWKEYDRIRGTDIDWRIREKTEAKWLKKLGYKRCEIDSICEKMGSHADHLFETNFAE